MLENEQGPSRELPGWIVTLGAALYTAFEVVLRPEALLQHALPLLLLVAIGAVCARFAGDTRDGTSARLAPAAVLAAAVTLPSPAALLVAFAAILATRGRGFLGPPFRGPTPAGASLVATAVIAYFSQAAIGDQGISLESLGIVALLFLVLQALAVGLTLALSADRAGVPVSSSWPRLILVELANIPLAWLLVGAVQQEAPTSLAVLAILACFAAWGLAALEASRGELRDSSRTLQRRLAELATLHSISREILSTLDSTRVFGVLDRECRKIFDVDHCMIALLDAETSVLRSVYRRRRGQAAKTGRSEIERGLLVWVAANKRPRRIDDVALCAGDPLVGPPLEGDSRSIVAVPLIVEDQVVGVLSLQSRHAEAYDDHDLEVLTTIGQQAAISLENARHYQMATVDSLTGFFTRDYFFRRLTDEDQRVRRYGGNFAVLMVDLDGFKEINDRNGHLAGDAYLSEIATTMREQLRGADLACRYGGDEFCLLLPETDLAGAQAIGERIREAVSRRIVGVEGLALRTTVSVGVAAYPENKAEDLQALLRKSDEALYRAKRTGRDRVVPYAA